MTSVAFLLYASLPGGALLQHRRDLVSRGLWPATVCGVPVGVLPLHCGARLSGKCFPAKVHLLRQYFINMKPSGHNLCPEHIALLFLLRTHLTLSPNLILVLWKIVFNTCSRIISMSFIHSFIHSFGHFYSASSSPLLLRGI